MKKRCVPSLPMMAEAGQGSSVGLTERAGEEYSTEFESAEKEWKKTQLKNELPDDHFERVRGLVQEFGEFSRESAEWEGCAVGFQESVARLWAAVIENKLLWRTIEDVLDDMDSEENRSVQFVNPVLKKLEPECIGFTMSVLQRSGSRYSQEVSQHRHISWESFREWGRPWEEISKMYVLQENIMSWYLFHRLRWTGSWSTVYCPSGRKALL